MNTTIKWIKYNNFFELREAHRSDTRMVYVIGDTDFVYIGSIGANGGLQGMRTRYQRQYLQRAKSIFRSSEPHDQPAYAGIFVTDVDQILVKVKVATIQHTFMLANPESNFMFKKPNMEAEVDLIHISDIPIFLKSLV